MPENSGILLIEIMTVAGITHCSLWHHLEILTYWLKKEEISSLFG